MSQPLEQGSPKHILLIVTDQQRWDSLGCTGASWSRTPNLDALAARGTAVERCFVQSTVCGPSRASLVSGQYCHHHGVTQNDQWLADGSPNWIEQLRQKGYHTANIGKMHTLPERLPCGFDYRWVVENKNHPYKKHKGEQSDHYEDLLADRGLIRPGLRYHEIHEDWYERLGATVWPLDEELFPDNVVGQRSVDYIEQHDFQDQPLFLWTGFAGPHDPFDVPQSALDAFGDPVIPPPYAMLNELSTKPASHADYMRWMNTFENPAAIRDQHATPERIRTVQRHYYANVMLIDQWVGRLVAALERRGVLRDTLIVFTSDHGECLWDHHLIYKFASHYEPVVGVPMVCAGPGVAEQGVINPLMQWIDLGPTLLDFAQVAPDDRFDGRSALGLLTGRERSIRDAVFSSYENRRMVRTERWKLVRYEGETLGELYDLAADPHELINRWDKPDCEPVKTELQGRLDAWLAS